MSTMPLTEVRDRFSEIIEATSESGEEWIITKHGRPVAVVIGYEDYEALLETVNILSDEETLSAIEEGLNDLDDK